MYYNILFIYYNLYIFIYFLFFYHNIHTKRKSTYTNIHINPVPTNTCILLTTTEVAMFKITHTKTAALNLEHI